MGSQLSKYGRIGLAKSMQTKEILTFGTNFNCLLSVYILGIIIIMSEHQQPFERILLSVEIYLEDYYLSSKVCNTGRCVEIVLPHPRLNNCTLRFPKRNLLLYLLFFLKKIKFHKLLNQNFGILPLLILFSNFNLQFYVDHDQ